jgi:hypothetical protein
MARFPQSLIPSTPLTTPVPNTSISNNVTGDHPENNDTNPPDGDGEDNHNRSKQRQHRNSDDSSSSDDRSSNTDDSSNPDDKNPYGF